MLVLPVLCLVSCSNMRPWNVLSPWATNYRNWENIAIVNTLESDICVSEIGITQFNNRSENYSAKEVDVIQLTRDNVIDEMVSKAPWKMIYDARLEDAITQDPLTENTFTKTKLSDETILKAKNQGYDCIAIVVPYVEQRLNVANWEYAGKGVGLFKRTYISRSEAYCHVLIGVKFYDLTDGHVGEWTWSVFSSTKALDEYFAFPDDWSSLDQETKDSVASWIAELYQGEIRLQAGDFYKDFSR